MGVLFNELVFCENNPCKVDGAMPRAAVVHLVLDAEYPRVPSLFTCPAGDPPITHGDARAAIMAGWATLGIDTAAISAEEDADLTRYIDMRFKRASEAWVFRVNFCKGLQVEPPAEPPAPEIPAEPPASPSPPAKTKVAGGGLGLVAVAIGLGLLVLKGGRR